MKKINLSSIKVLIISIIMISADISNSYTVDVISPKPCQSNFSFIHYPLNIIECKFRILREHVFDVDTILYRIYAEQNGNQLMLAEGICRSGDMINLTLNLQNFTSLCFNEPAAIRIDAKRYDGLGVVYSGRGFLIAYKDGQSCRYSSKSNGVSELMNTDLIPVTFLSNCGGLATGTYFVKRYRIIFTFNGNFSDSIPVLESSLCLGYTGAGPNNQQYWAGILDSSQTQWRIVTFAYNVFNILGQSLGYWPCRPDQATITYRMIKKPNIQSISMFPLSITPSNNVAHFRSNLLSGNGNIVFQWKDSNVTSIPANMEYSGIRSRTKFNFTNTAPGFFAEDRAYYIFAKAGNEAGETPWIKRKLRISYSPVLCPVLSIKEGEDYLEDNSILLSSYSEPGRFVKDYLMLENPFLQDKDELIMKLSESSADETKLDCINIRQITVNPDESVAVTNNGEVINYRLSNAKPKILKNDDEDISDALMYDDDESADLKKGDTLKIDLMNGGGNYIVIKLYGPQNKEYAAGFIKTAYGFSEKFYSHDNQSTVCFQLNNSSLNEAVIEIEQDVTIGQIAFVQNLNTAFKKDLNMKSATGNKFRDLRDILKKPDGSFAKVSNGSDINLTFQNRNTTPDKKSYYLCFTEGEIIRNADNEKNGKVTNSAQVNKNKLSDNAPNPFNPVTKFTYEITTGSFVRISVYDISGREIKAIVNEYKNAGRYESVFDGSALSSGVYFYRMETSNGFRDTKRMTLIK